MYTCDQALELISAKLDGELSQVEETLLNEHLAGCPECRDLLADLEEVREAMPHLWVEPPADLKDRVMDRIRSDNVPSLPARRSKNRWKGWAALAAVCAVIILGANSLRYLNIGADSSGATGSSSGGGSAPAASSAPQAAAPAGGGMMSMGASGASAETAEAPAEAAEPEAQAAPETRESDTCHRPLEDGSEAAGPVEGGAPAASASVQSSAPVPSAAPEEAGHSDYIANGKLDGGGGQQAGSAMPGDRADETTASISPDPAARRISSEDRALERLYQLLGGEAVYTREPLPNRAPTGLLLHRTEDAPEGTPAYAAVVYVNAVVRTAGTQAEGYCFHFHADTEEDLDPDSLHGIYTTYIVWADGTTEHFEEEAPCGNSGCEAGLGSEQEETQ